MQARRLRADLRPGGVLTRLDAADLRMLIARRNHVLARMSVLASVSAKAMRRDAGYLPRKAGGSKLPPGLKMSVEPTDPDRPPDKDRDLFDFYVWHFKRVTDADELLKVVMLAERDLWGFQHTGETTAEVHRARNRSILSSKYQDVPPEVVAAIERCSNAHVRKQRSLNGLDPLTARPVERVHGDGAVYAGAA